LGTHAFAKPINHLSVLSLGKREYQTIAVCEPNLYAVVSTDISSMYYIMQMVETPLLHQTTFIRHFVSYETMMCLLLTDGFEVEYYLILCDLHLPKANSECLNPNDLVNEHLLGGVLLHDSVLNFA
jgi:hypothetical protein